jgi:hypothetical protein
MENARKKVSEVIYRTLGCDGAKAIVEQVCWRETKEWSDKKMRGCIRLSAAARAAFDSVRTRVPRKHFVQPLHWRNELSTKHLLLHHCSTTNLPENGVFGNYGW